MIAYVDENIIKTRAKAANALGNSDQKLGNWDCLIAKNQVIRFSPPNEVHSEMGLADFPVLDGGETPSPDGRRTVARCR